MGTVGDDRRNWLTRKRGLKEGKPTYLSLDTASKVYLYKEDASMNWKLLVKYSFISALLVVFALCLLLPLQKIDAGSPEPTPSTRMKIITMLQPGWTANAELNQFDGRLIEEAPSPSEVEESPTAALDQETFDAIADANDIDINPDGGWTGSADVEIQVQDSGSLTDTDTFNVTVTGGSNIYLPLALKDYIGMGTAPAAPTLSPIDNIDGDGNYTVSWSTSSGATAYTLQEATNPTFSGATTAYSGPNNSSISTGKLVGTYYYRVNASNTYGTSSWSNTETVLVSITPSGPEPGHYTGTPSVSFDVTEEQQVCNFDITIPINGGTCRKILDGCADIVDDKFSFIKDFPPFTVNDYEITGTFNTQTHALGDYAVWYCDPTLYFTPFEGIWEASK